jgi:transcription initiation factor IIE alpha subunit
MPLHEGTLKLLPAQEGRSMRFDYILDEVFSTWSHISTLRVLLDAARPLSGREIARRAHMNHRSCLQALTRLEHIGFVNCSRGERDHLFSINREHRLWHEGILPMLEIERRHFGRLIKRLRKELGMYVESAILYGNSVMKRDAQDTTVDLCLIINNWMTEQEIRSYVDAVTLIAWKRYGAKLRTIIFTEIEFVRRVKRSHASVQTILKEGQVISGKMIRELIGIF